MEDEVRNILETFKSVEKDLHELINTDDFSYYVAQIAGRDSFLNSFPSLLKELENTNQDVKLAVAEITKRLSYFMLIFNKRSLSFFYAIPSNETEEDFFNKPIKIINQILVYGLEKGKIPIPDENPIYEAFGISHYFPEMKERFRDSLLLAYRNVLLTQLLTPITQFSSLPIIPKTNIRKQEFIYNTELLFKNIYVIESEEGMKQGTAFFLKDVGIVTCDHCIRYDDSTEILTDLIIYARHDLNKKYNLKLIKTHKDIDIAIFEVPENITESGLEVGSSRELNQLHSIAVAGFPNYNFGDSGTIGTGSITGFRNHLGLRHLLISCPLISGNSGGPALNNDSKVIGIAVTGADKMSKAHETEKHMLIPIESLSLLGFKI